MYVNKILKQQGFSLVELMVSLVISLLVGMAALSSLQFYSSLQRQHSGQGGATANLAIALSSLKQEIAQAGLGFFDQGKLSCPGFNISIGQKAVASGAALFPVQLVQNGTSPSVSVHYATALESASGSLLTTAQTSSSEAIQIGTYLPVSAGQAVAMAPSAETGGPCTIKTVTQVTASEGSGQTLAFAATGKHNQYAFAETTYPVDSPVLLLGAFREVTFSVNAKNELVLARPWEGTSAVVANNVVAFAVQYGIAETGRAAIAGWRYPVKYPSLDTGAEDWSSLDASKLARVRAIRVAALVRSVQKDPKTAQGCETTTSAPSLLGTPVGQLVPASEGVETGTRVTAALEEDWGCYRYVENTVVVPLRNVVMGVSL